MMKLLLLLSCIYVLTLEAKPASGFYANPDVDELRVELEDVKSALHATQVDLSLLDEKYKKPGQLSTLEKKIATMEKSLDKITADLRAVAASLNQTLEQVHSLETNLSSHDEKMSALKGTLSSISQAIAPPRSDLYRVKAGDTLEKIARQHHLSPEKIRQLNHLNSDKIIVGQELRLSHEP